MNVVSDPRPIAGADVQPSHDTTLRAHPAFCQIALPVRSSKGVWKRDLGAVSVTIEAGASLDSDGEHREAGHPIPTGKFARLLLIHICDAAIRADSPVVELGESAREFAEKFDPELKGPKLRELIEQLERLLAARITVSLDGGLALAMFDARGRARGIAPAWRPSVRLNSKFFAGLTAAPVVLDRRIVDQLADTPMALDAYTWLCFLLPQIEAGSSSFASWDDLLARFAPASQQLDEFRAAFEQSLRQVSELCPQLSLVMREQGVECRVSARRMPAVPVAAPATAAPVIAATGPAAPEPVVAKAPAPKPAPVVVAAPDTVSEPDNDLEIDMEREIAAEIASSLAVPVAEAAAAVAGPIPSAPRTMPPAAVPPSAPVTPAPGSREFQRDGMRQSISLKSHLTGLTQVIWLQRSNGRDNLVIEVTQGGRYDPDNVTVLALEPMILQIAGGLHARDFERVAAWANANRDLIDEFWDGEIDSFDEITGRVKKVPPPGWR